ncbi:LysR substrate-binding domain-containing protein [Ramlibacter pallidus]|uniref:LysR family transcriptional regulator n=1 Tax=Ramlibacter pallidus TaxID=2780087 RepID=A0ABR9S6F5_9BURK|nr:LysR substrate-binding domain-containing protein [Ramlibacter pallidus]MBE7369063.1 LysR family transcriptional regulator [Ramlibacter pallidus]
MKTHLLRYFVVLAEELHFGRAAQRLSITQPPLSSAIKALEDELGVQLLERSSKHVALTPAGAAFLKEARLVLERVASASETARAVAAGKRGRLEVGFTGSMIYREVPRIVAGFSARLPDIEVQLRELSSSEQVEALLHGQLDVGFVNAATVPPPLSALPLADDTLVCCLPAAHRLAAHADVDLRELADEVFVMFARDVAPANHDNVVAVLSRAGVHPRTRHAARQWLSIVALVAAGTGVALVPASLVQAGIAGARLVPIRGAGATAAAVMAWNGERGSPLVAAFVEAARDQLQARP